MFYLKDLATEEERPSTARPVWAGGVWEMPDFRVLDADGSRFEVIEPEPAPPIRHITVLAFRNRFTQAEKVAMEIAALDNPAATMPQRAQAAAIRASVKDTQAALFIDLDRADTRAGVIQMETGGLLAAGRAAHILDDEIQDHERPPSV